MQQDVAKDINQKEMMSKPGYKRKGLFILMNVPLAQCPYTCCKKQNKTQLNSSKTKGFTNEESKEIILIKSLFPLFQSPEDYRSQKSEDL